MSHLGRFLSRLRRGLPAAAALGLAAFGGGCPALPGEPCISGNQCPTNSYCLLSRCVASATISQNLSVLVSPTDPSLTPQQFLSRQYQTVDGFSTLMLRATQSINGPVELPANCPGDAGYPVELDFTAPSAIPGIPNAFQFFSNAWGDVQATLPVGSYVDRISTAAGCAAPILGNDLVSADTPFVFPVFPAPPVPAGQGENDAGSAPSLNIAGQFWVPFSDAGAYSPTVRIRAPADAGALAGTVLSGDQPLVHLDDGGLWIGFTFVPGGVGALPVQPPPGGGIIQEVIKTPVQIEAQSTVCDQDNPEDAGLFRVICDKFVVELGPSATQPELPTIDLEVNAPETDGGEAGEGTDVILPANAMQKLTFNPVSAFGVSILAEGPGSTPQASVPLTSTPITMSTTDGGGIAACLEAGITCSLNNTTTTDPFDGTATFHVVPGRYAVTLQPRSPLGQSVTSIDVFSGGRLSGNSVVVEPDGGQLVIIAAVAPVAVQGTIHEVSADGPLLPAGEVHLLTRPGMVQVAQQAVSGGGFDLAAPPGDYILLIEPDATTRFPVYYTDLTALPSSSSLRQSYVVPAPGLLSGIVERADDDGGLPIAVPSYLQFFYVATDGAGDSIAVPVATAVTDSLGRWSAPGPPGE